MWRDQKTTRRSLNYFSLKLYYGVSETGQRLQRGGKKKTNTEGVKKNCGLEERGGEEEEDSSRRVKER